MADLTADPAALLAERAPGLRVVPRAGGGGMTEPVRVGELLPGVLAEVVDRAGHGYQRWAELVAQAGYCHHPIRLAGRVEQADRTTGEVRQVYDSQREPDGVLLKACGTRRDNLSIVCGRIPGRRLPTPRRRPPGRQGRPRDNQRASAAVRHLHRAIVRPGPLAQGPGAIGAAVSAVPARRSLPACLAGGCWNRHVRTILGSGSRSARML